MELRRRGSSERIALEDGQVLGRLAACEVQLDDASVSRKHAQIEVRGESYALIDLGSSNGIFQNGQRAKRVELRVGDLITVGAVPFDVVAPIGGVSGGTSPAAAVSAEDVFEVPVAGEPEAPRSAYAETEAQRARLHTAHGRSRRSRGFGDLSQQPMLLRYLIYVAGLGLMWGIIQGVRLIGGSV